MIDVAVIWGEHRNDLPFHTHHSFWEATLKERPDTSVTRYTWGEWKDMPKTHDLYFFVDFHASLYDLPRHGFKNTALYWWDSYHKPLVHVLELLNESFDRAYFAEYVSSAQARGYGLPVKWLPAAFYPGVYRPLPDHAKIHDYGYVGQADSVIVRKGDTKLSFLSKLSRAKGLHGFVGRGIYGHDVNRAYNDSKILFERTIFATVGTRFFEMVGSGGFCLMNRMRPPSGIEHLAADGIHYVSYDDSYQDFDEKLRHWLARPEERERIVRQAQAYFLERHTYLSRLDEILSDFNLK